MLDILLNLPSDFFEGLSFYFSFWWAMFSNSGLLINLFLFPLFLVLTLSLGITLVIMFGLGLAALSLFLLVYLAILTAIIVGICKLFGISKTPNEIPIIKDLFSWIGKLFKKVEKAGDEAHQRVYGKEKERIKEKIAFLHYRRLPKLEIFTEDENLVTQKFFYEGKTKGEILTILLANPADTLQKLESKVSEMSAETKSYYQKEYANGNLDRWFKNLGWENR